MLPIGHKSGIISAQFSQDGKRVVTASGDNTAKIWDTYSGKMLADLTGHTKDVIYAKFSLDGTKIVTTSYDSTAKIWDAYSGKILATIKEGSPNINDDVFSLDGKKIILISQNKSSTIWDTYSGKLLAKLVWNSDNPEYARFNPDGNKITTPSQKIVGKIPNDSSNYLPSYLKLQSNDVVEAGFSSDGNKIVTVTRNGIAKIWDAFSGHLLFNLKNNSPGIDYIKFIKNGNKLITISKDSTLKTWDALTGRLLANIKWLPGNFPFLEFSPDGEKLVLTCGDSTAKIYHASSGNLLAVLKDYSGQIHLTHFSPDGKNIITIAEDSLVKIWDVLTGHPLAGFNTKSSYSFAEYSPTGKKIVTAFEDGTAKIWDASTGSFLTNLKGHADKVIFPINAIAYPKDVDNESFPFSADGKKMVAVSTDSTCKIWDVFSGHLLTDLKGHPHNVWGAELSPDGKKVWTILLNDFIKIWDVSTGSLLTILKDSFNINGYTQVGFSPDAKKIVTISILSDSTARLWDVSSGILIAVLKGHAGPIFFARFSPDGKNIMTNSNDGIVKIWDASTGNLLKNIKAHTGRKRDFAKFSPDGEKIITYSVDSTAKTWAFSSGNLLAEINVHALISHAKFSPDGKQIVINSKNDFTSIWDATSGNLLANLPGGSNLSRRYSPDGKKIITGSNGDLKIWDASTFQLLTDLNKNFTAVFNLGFSPDGEEIFARTDAGLAILDASSGKVLTTFKESPLFDYAKFSPDGKHIVCVSLSLEDNGFTTWDVQTGKLLYTFFAVDSTDFIVVDKYNRFDGPEAARKLLYFTCGTEIIELDQLKDQLWVPNLAERLNNGEIINAKTLDEVNICGLTPEVEDVSTTKNEYHFKIKARRGGLGETALYVNGIEARRYKPAALKNNAGRYDLIIPKSELKNFFIPGKENRVSVKAWTSNNAISSRGAVVTADADSTSAAPPNLYAVMVGVSDYKGDELDLKYAAKDATDISGAVSNAAKKLLNADGKDHVFMYNLTTEKEHYQLPEKLSIKRTLEDIGKKATANDILLIFFAGHGVMYAPVGKNGQDEKKQFYFLTADASKTSVTDAVADVGISTAELTEWMKPQNIKAQKRILIFDACNSGQAIKDFVKMGNNNQNYLAARNDDKAQQTKAIDKLNEKSGLFIFSASASNQNAYEMGRYSQGLLTYSLLKAIKQQPDILEDGKYLNISRWFNAAEKTVSDISKESGARQEPQIVSNTNFNIGVVDDEVRNRIVLPFEKPMFTRSDFRNIDLRTDNLKLRALVDKQLGEISDNSSSAYIMYSPEYDGADVYAISGDYTVTGNNISFSVIVTKGGTEIKTRFEIKGTLDQLSRLAASVTNTVLEWLKKEK